MNYIGSKLSLMDFLTSTIQDVTGISNGDGHRFADLFAGTGIVGSTYREQGWQVISNDIQAYSYALNKHYITNPSNMTDGLTDYLNGLDGIDGFVYNNYCLGSGSERCYFTDENGKKCDAIRIKIEELLKSGEISENQYYWYLASLINSRILNLVCYQRIQASIKALYTTKISMNSSETKMFMATCCIWTRPTTKGSIAQTIMFWRR